jgi:hypothetical protein
MAENAGTASTTIANRVRDPNFQATSQANIISLMSYAQQVTNGALSDVVATATLNLAVRTPIYQLSTNIAAAIKVLAVTDASGRDLDCLPDIFQLQQLDFHWLTYTSDRPRDFVQVGKDLLIIWPGVLASQPMTVKYSKYIPALTGSGDATVVPNEDDTCINALTEALLVLKNRDLNATAQAFERFTKRLENLRMSRR